MPTIRGKKLLMLALLAVPLSHADELSNDDLMSLDGQVQEIKADVLNIAAELGNLEERLLFPSNTQVSVFVELDTSDVFRLDAIEIEINGEPAVRHIYSFQELEALRKGGVQRAYTGNVSTGVHAMQVTILGKLANGRDFTETDSFTFDKDVHPKALGLTFAGPGLGQDGIRLSDW